MANNRFFLDTDIWNRDYTELSIEEHGMYTLLCSQKLVSLCGVLHYSPKRIAMLMRGLTQERVEELVRSLEALRYVIVDRDTDELIIRTFVKNSGCLNQPNVVVGMTKQFASIASPKLRAVVLGQVHDAVQAGNDKVRPKHFDRYFAEEFEEFCLKPLANPSANPSPKGSQEALSIDQETLSGSLQGTHAPTTDYRPRTTNHNLVDLEADFETRSDPGPGVEDEPRPLALVAPLKQPKGPSKTQVVEVWDYWREIMNSPNSDLTPDRESKIRTALKHFTIDECKQAVLGCSLTPHNMGKNENGTKYNGVKVIFKDADQVERFKSVPAQRTPETTSSKPKWWWIDGGPQNRPWSADAMQAGHITYDLEVARERGVPNLPPPRRAS